MAWDNIKHFMKGLEGALISHVYAKNFLSLAMLSEAAGFQ